MDGQLLNHQQLIASLSDTEREAFTRKSDWPGLFHFSSIIIVLAITSSCISLALPGWQFALVFQGITLVFLFTLLHETSHFTAFKTRRLNTILGWFCALIIFLPPAWFRYFHLAHHRHTNDPEKDPELANEKPQNWSGFLWAVSGIPVWRFHIRTIFQNAFTDFHYDYLPDRRKPEIRTEARAMIAIYSLSFSLAVYFNLTEIVWLWLLPLAVGQPFLRLYLMAEHGRCPHVANMLENTRTTFTNRLVRWLAWNMPYHTEHHVYPSVPFHQLPKFHEVAKKHLRVTANSYTAFHKETIEVLSGGSNK